MTQPSREERPATIVISDWLANCQTGQWTPFEAATALKATLAKEGFTVARTARIEELEHSAVAQALPSEPVAWLDIRTAGFNWNTRIVATNPQYVENNGSDNFVALYAAVPASSGEVRDALVAADGLLDALRIFPENHVRAKIRQAIAAMDQQPPGDQADICAGGVNPGWDECPKCGATMDDECQALKSPSVAVQPVGETLDQFLVDMGDSVAFIKATDRQKEVFKASLRYAISHARRLADERQKNSAVSSTTRGGSE